MTKFEELSTEYVNILSTKYGFLISLEDVINCLIGWLNGRELPVENINGKFQGVE